jgi:hypothetical protein
MSRREAELSHDTSSLVVMAPKTENVVPLRKGNDTSRHHPVVARCTFRRTRLAAVSGRLASMTNRARQKGSGSVLLGPAGGCAVILCRDCSADKHRQTLERRSGSVIGSPDWEAGMGTNLVADMRTPVTVPSAAVLRRSPTPRAQRGPATVLLGYDGTE